MAGSHRISPDLFLKGVGCRMLPADLTVAALAVYPPKINLHRTQKQEQSLKRVYEERALGLKTTTASLKSFQAKATGSA